MERNTNRLLSSCLIWVIAFLLVSGCLVPASLFVAGMSTFFSEDLIASTLGPFLCPEKTMPTIKTYQSTELDVKGFPRQATYYEMVCLDMNGISIKNLGGSYALIWSGIFAVFSLILAAVFSVIITFLFLRFFRKKTNLNSPTPPLVKIQ
ncbi:MAG: hypothetical protein CVU41_14155 [Chloroflexi bacterium HGW-Chloroflexi-3]|nr:MAG: hypothetical protein CVU41_14155 [Chloroflexi bacterium HGW-Chloroflexi-3]